MADAGTIARFASADALVGAACAARESGYRRVEAYAPFPVPGLSEALGFTERRIPPLALVAGVLVAAAALAMQWYSAVISYPFVTGGKPLASWPAFMIVTFEAGILGSVLTAFVAMLAGNRLPRPHHPAFDWDAFEDASTDGYFLLLGDGDADERRSLLERLGAAELLELSS